MAQCITCGARLHPERAQKYNYCMARECQEKNAKGLTMVAVGMNKAGLCPIGGVNGVRT